MPDQGGGAEEGDGPAVRERFDEVAINCGTGKFAVIGGSIYGVCADSRATPSRT